MWTSLRYVMVWLLQYQLDLGYIQELQVWRFKIY